MPYYSLEKIIAAANAQQIIYGGRKVNSDIANLGYTLDEVARCISQLKPEHYRKTHKFEDNSTVYDDYVIEFSPQEEKPDSIYIKLRLLENGEVQIGLGSFHLS
ncbi:MAG: type II toxin-antitoxin system MqsR family toxin [Methyloglobulus sp.]